MHDAIAINMSKNGERSRSVERHQRRRRRKWAGKTFNFCVVCEGKTRKVSWVYYEVALSLCLYMHISHFHGGGWVINDLVCNKLRAGLVCHMGIRSDVCAWRACINNFSILSIPTTTRRECRTDLHLKKDFPPSHGKLIQDVVGCKSISWVCAGKIQ